METQFVDRILTCSDCHGEFIFTAGEQLFFYDKQFKNDPKRCKPCKSRRSGLSAVASGAGPAAAGLSRTETRTECSECGVQTTVPFKPTQGRPVLCRQCFQAKAKAAAASAATGLPATPAPAVIPVQTPAAVASTASASPGGTATASALTIASKNQEGTSLSPAAAALAAASMASASPHSSVASAADLRSIGAVTSGSAYAQQERAADSNVPAAIMAAENGGQEMRGEAGEA